MAVTTIGQLIESIRLLFLVLVLVPLRRGELWAWCTCWVLLIAYVGYTVTTAQDGSTSFAYSLVADMGLPVLLVVQLSRFGRREDPTLLNVRKLTVGQPRRESIYRSCSAARCSPRCRQPHSAVKFRPRI